MDIMWDTPLPALVLVGRKVGMWLRVLALGMPPPRPCKPLDVVATFTPG